MTGDHGYDEYVRRFTRDVMVTQINDSRTPFLAAIDQVVVDIRQRLQEDPSDYEESLISCARMFADVNVMRDDIVASHPEMAERPIETFQDAHMVSVAYLFSLAVHELARSPWTDDSIESLNNDDRGDNRDQ